MPQTKFGIFWRVQEPSGGRGYSCWVNSKILSNTYCRPKKGHENKKILKVTFICKEREGNTVIFDFSAFLPIQLAEKVLEHTTLIFLQGLAFPQNIFFFCKKKKKKNT